MATSWFDIAVQASAIACAIVAGVFATFSEFVMRSLHQSRRHASIEVMQQINREVFRTTFMVLLIGMSAVAPVLAVYAVRNLSAPTATAISVAGGIYLLTVFAVTLRCNVPMNNHLARLEFSDAEAGRYWEQVYYPRWTRWNHVRTLGAGAAAVAYLHAALLLAQYPQSLA